MSTTYDAGRWAVATLTVVLLGAGFIVVWVVTGRPPPPSPGNPVPWLEWLVTIVSYGVAGALLIDRRPDLIFGWLLAGTAVLVSVQAVAVLPASAALMDGARGGWAEWALATGSFGFLPVAVQGLVNVRFPSGRPAGRRGALLEAAIVVGTVLVVLGGFLGGSLIDGADGIPAVANPLTGGTPFGRVADGLIVLAPVVVLLGLIAGLGVVWRFHRADGPARQQLKWRAVGVLVALALFPFAVTGHLAVLTVFDAPLFVLTLAVPVLRYRLWAIDTIVRRSLAYGLVTVVLVLAYLAVTAAVAHLASDRLGAASAAVVVALAFTPVRRTAQRLMDRVFYGDRDDPYRTLRELGRRLNAVPHGDVLGSLVQAVAGSLRLPYVAIERADGIPLAATGTSSDATERWPLTYERSVTGYLIAAPRRGQDGFDASDRELLADIAGQIGVAVHAVGLTAQLVAARQRLVTAREEERRRLRRDLHDGLGPVLTAIGLTLDAARATVSSDPGGAEHHVAQAKEATTQALADLRRLVHGLRPPVLDDLGLAAALRAQAARLGADSTVDVTVDVGPLPDLPAAVEVAVFRIAIEAVTNAVRHSGAGRCRVRVSAADDAVELTVDDDGPTVDEGHGSWTPGVGLTAMRERAEELGGALHAGPDPDGGAAVTVRLPLTGMAVPG